MIVDHISPGVLLESSLSNDPILIPGKAIDSIYKKPTSIFVKATARELLFDGLPIDCTVTDFAGSAVCALLKSQAKDLIPVGENMYKFSIFGHVSRNVMPLSSSDPGDSLIVSDRFFRKTVL